MKKDIRCRVMPIAILMALGQSTGFSRAVSVEDNRIGDAQTAQPLAHVFAHFW